MLNEKYVITYSTKGGEGKIELNTSDPNFEETLREVEQKLADTGAMNIVYTRYPEED